MSLRELGADAAQRLARTIESNLEREFPHARCLSYDRGGRWKGPRSDHPIFHGCYDWHSAVHSHWALLVIGRLFDGETWAGDLRERVLTRFSSRATNRELDFLERHPGFEMPYGIAWLLALGAELRHPIHGAAGALRPLVEYADRAVIGWLDRLPAPTRCGQHGQSAFAMLLALSAAGTSGDHAAAQRIELHARRFYEGDRNAPLDFEPSAYDFLSPCLSEALLMAWVLGDSFASWYRAFATRPLSSLAPVVAADRNSGKLVHWDGLNTSRAWMMRSLAAAMDAEDPEGAALRDSARSHRKGALDAIFSGHYAGTHWLGSFALLALADGALAPYHEGRG